MTELLNLALIEVKGKDARAFLHDQLSADIRTLAPGESTFAGLCRPDGRVLALLLVWAQDDRFGMVCSSSLAGTVTTHLAKYVLRADVEFRSRDDLQVVGLKESASGDTVLQPLPNLRYVIRPAGDEGDEAAWKAAELVRGVAWLDVVSSGEFLPQMLGHEHIGALSFRKGCFPGQEVIARVRYLGNLKRRPLLVRCEETLEPEPLESATLLGGEVEHDAVIVDAACVPGGSILFTVVRGEEGIEPDRMAFRGQRFDIRAAGLMEGD